MTIIEYVCCHDLCGSVDCVSLILVTLRGSFMASWHFGWKILQEDAQLTSFHPTNDLRPHPSVRPSVRPSTLHSTFAHSGLPSRIRGFLRLVSAKAAFARAKLTLFPRSKCSLDFPCLTFDPSQTNDFYIEKWQPCTVADERKVATLYSC